MGYLFTSESVSEGHPDKIADQISDALLDEFLRQDPDSKVAVETLVTTGLVVISGEVKTKAWVDVQKTARKVIKNIGYTNPEYKFEGESCGVISTIHEQSPDINQGVERKNEIGAGDQGIMFGYAVNETEEYMPLPIVLAHMLLQDLTDIRKNNPELMPYLRPDAKSQVTVEYDDNGKPLRIHTIVISTQHDEFDDDEDLMQRKIKEDLLKYLIPKTKERLPKHLKKLFDFDKEFVFHVNPTGKFVIGGPHGDTGLTGRKIIVDTYGGKAPHGGGAFSGKDATKVDRSAAYAARYVAKNLVHAGVADEVLLQLSYAIGIAKPISIYVNTFGTAKVNMTDQEIAKRINDIFDFSPKAIIDKFGLRYPIFKETAAYGHLGRDPYEKEVLLSYVNKDVTHTDLVKKVQFFGWEKLDLEDKIKEVFKL
jgi:S-adenosylmethionine synthetase